MEFFTFSWGKNYIAMRALLKELGHTLSTPGEINDKVIKKGIEHSPGFMCYSGKAVIGQLLEQLEKGKRNLFFLSSQGIEACRCADTGFFFEYICRDRYPGFKAYRLGANTREESIKIMEKSFPGTSARKHDKAMKIYFWKLGVLDLIARESLKLRAYVICPEELARLEDKYIAQTDKAGSPAVLWLTGFGFSFHLNRLKKKKEAPPVKIGIVGGEHILSEIDSIMARIKSLSEKGIHMEWRSGFFAMNKLSAGRNLGSREKRNLDAAKQKCQKYLRPEDTGSEILSCSHACEFAEEGFDGLLHIYSFGCMPQITVKPALKRISHDFRIPLLSLSLGDHFNEGSIETRIEAFLDILNSRKRKEKCNE